jgi:hypothetical protein
MSNVGFAAKMFSPTPKEFEGEQSLFCDLADPCCEERVGEDNYRIAVFGFGDSREYHPKRPGSANFWSVEKKEFGHIPRHPK